MNANTDAYYAAHRERVHEHAARNAARLWPGQALLYTTVDGSKFQPFPSRVPAGSVRSAVRSVGSARIKHVVHVYDITARDGSPLRIVCIRHGAGTWSNVDEVIDVYELSIEALTGL